MMAGNLSTGGDHSPASSVSTIDHVAHFLLGICMASSIDPCAEDPGGAFPQDDEFALWAESWDALVPAWELQARALGWRAVGMCWEYHHARDWAS
jgi:hypothetical protein